MNTRKLVSIGLVGALLAGTTLATASSDTGAARRAATSARQAEKAIARHQADKAVAAAEAAVALQPTNAAYRATLGQAYLTAGRFASAANALAESLSLDPANGEAALHLALAQIGTGDWGAARKTLDQHAGQIPSADRGLALALAGDPATAVTVLTEAARQPGANAKTRQNLALALALGGRWAEARTVAAVDIAPAEVDQRIMQWAAFARPSSASDQVASLLGVTPVADQGQPERLALRTTAPTMAAVAQPVATAEAYTPPVEAAPAPIAETAPVEVAAVAPVAKPGITFAPAREIVQAIPLRAARPAVASAPALTRWVRPVAKSGSLVPAAVQGFAPARGQFHVQLGAYDSPAVARDAWVRLSRGVPVLAKLSPYGASVKANGADFYRLSVGGFARADADRLCYRIRARGSRCFVREAQGDKTASWGGVQVAAR